MIDKYYSGGGMAIDEEGQYYLVEDIAPRLALMDEMAIIFRELHGDEYRGIAWNMRERIKDILIRYEESKEGKG